MSSGDQRNTRSDRRQFVKASTAALSAGAFATTASANVHVGGSDVLRIGLIGCGGRGTGAATQALNADPNLKLVAMGDMFKDRLQQSLQTLKRDEAIASKVDVQPDHCFTGFDAFKQVIHAGVDVVLMASPPHFRPAHLKAAVDAGKHIFCEKPVAVDGPGVRSVLETCEIAKSKGLAVVSGLCYRYENSKREVMKRIHDGAVGDIVALHTTYNTGALWHKPRQDSWTDMEWQLRNWLYFTWLSGDHIVEQHVHSLDKMAWVMKDEYPIRAVGTGGRQTRTGPEFGHIFDHHAVTFEYANGVKCFSFCRQQAGAYQEVTDFVLGTHGTVDVMKHMIAGKKGKWRYRDAKGTDVDMYQSEHNELFASIRAGKPINNGNYMSKSSLMAIMGRMATYTGQAVTWDMALNSKEDLTPAKYEFGPLPLPPVPRPGITKLV